LLYLEVIEVTLGYKVVVEIGVRGGRVEAGEAERGCSKGVYQCGLQEHVPHKRGYGRRTWAGY